METVNEAFRRLCDVCRGRAVTQSILLPVPTQACVVVVRAVRGSPVSCPQRWFSTCGHSGRKSRHGLSLGTQRSTCLPQ